MEGQEGTQELHLVLAHKLFLLRHPDVQDIEKVRLKEEVFAVVKADGESPIPTEFFSS
jgi:26S proteasome regulatory subunit N7